MSPIFFACPPRRIVPHSLPLVSAWLAVGISLTGCAVQGMQLTPPIQVTGESAEDAASYWPMALETPEGRIEVYQPQPEAMKGDLLTARAVVSLTRPGASTPVLGATWFDSHVVIDRDTRMVTLHDVKVNDVRLSGSTAAEQKDFASAIGGQLSNLEVTFPLDQLVTTLDTARQDRIEATHLETAPPRIVFSTTPATLISVNGPPRLQPMEGQPGVSRVVNTPFILLFDGAGRRYYLKAGLRWVSAPDLPGPWADATNVPPPIAAAGQELATPAPDSTHDAKAPPADQSASDAPTGAELSPAAADAKIIVATEPTELIVTTGNPQFTPVAGGAGGELLYASNTESDLFLDQGDHRFYVLLSGRWYAAASFPGPWQYVPSDKLSPAFVRIPADSPKADVLSFVAGTTEAHEAVLDASIPQTASIRHDAGADLSVAYDGNPQFKDVPESPGVAYALNTPEDVLLVKGRYYCCHQAVWYDSASSTGPWTVCVSVPQVIYTLPPSCPVYHVRYVHVYDYTPTYVTCGYLPGYTGTLVFGPTIVYGTGFNYPGWYGSVYFPPPCTWGFSAYFDPFVCAWGFDVGLFWGRTGWFSHPWHDRWWHDHPDERWGTHRWWGPGGFVNSHEIRNHFADGRSGGIFRTGEHHGGLAARMPDTDARGRGWNNLYSRDGNAGRNFPESRSSAFTPANRGSDSRDNVFAGSDGRVFRRSGAGWEEQRGADGKWSGMDHVPEARPNYTPTPGETHAGGSFGRPESGLDQHFDARSRGAVRSHTVHGVSGGGGHGGGGHHR